MVSLVLVQPLGQGAEAREALLHTRIYHHLVFNFLGAASTLNSLWGSNHVTCVAWRNLTLQRKGKGKQF